MRKSFLFTIVVLFAALVSGLAPHAVADQQEALGVGPGASSGGSIGITLRIPEMIRLSGLRDLELSFDEASEIFEASARLCVWQNTEGGYSVTASSSNGGDAFRLRNGDSSIDYRVEWDEQYLESGQRMEMASATRPESMDCDGEGNVAMRVHTGADEVTAAEELVDHADTLTLKVVAE